ncbi:alpha/beta-hydrolase [Backusella circina FSU 941]|nr:alpha/beta-hydrolase [Backusella circina FSU 941]
MSTYTYGPIPNENARSLDLYEAPNGDATTPLVVIVHGGAWRTEDKADYEDLALQFNDQGFSVASVNYRLSLKGPDNIQHPSHIVDVAQALQYLANASHTSYDPQKIYLVGHSAGAHIITMLLLDDTFHCTHLIRGLIGTDGIYDLPLLVDRYPSYLDFIAQAFGNDTSTYAAASPTHKRSNAHAPVLIIQSLEDELLDTSQSEAMVRHLLSLKMDVVLDTSAPGGHYQMMHTPRLFQLVINFMKKHH